MEHRSLNEYCKICGRTIFWVEDERGRPMPLDPYPAEGGDITIVNGVARFAGEMPILQGFVRHSTTCIAGRGERR